jgi:transcriptional regulator with PAS, ATPase and Fis domain
MSITVEIPLAQKSKESLHPLIQYLSPSVEGVLRSESGIIEIFLQLNKAENISEIVFRKFIKLVTKPMKMPLHHHSYPMLYQRKEIGTLRLSRLPVLENGKNKTDTDRQHGIQISRKLSLLVKRYQSTHLSNHYLGEALSLNGYSNEILELDSFIEKAASTFCPVIICGNVGSEKLTVASAIHYNSDRKHKAFIEINCSTPSIEEFQKNILQNIKRAKGGCIFFHGIDELSQPQQNLLTELLAASSSLGAIDSNLSNIRIFVSTTLPLEDLISNKYFSRDLYEKFNFLNIQLPNLLQRKDDLPYILEKLVKKYCLFATQELSGEVKKVFYDYHWPKNYAEMDQTVARLLTFATSNPVNLADVQQHSPQILSQLNAIPLKGHLDNRAKYLDLNLIASLQRKDYQLLERLHTGLQKALIFLAENYIEALSLTILSQKAFISPSHLSYLFKHTLNKTFKQILTELRIEKAQQIITDNPQRLITQVSFDVGFGDLSHFEKMFKRYTQMTPRAYKKIIQSRT